MTDDYYKSQYKTAEHRALYLVARKGYGSFAEMADALKVSKAYIGQCCTKGLPANYAGYLGRKFGFHPGILAFEELLSIVLKGVDLSYPDLVEYTNFFDHDDRKYILAGTYIKDPAKYLRQKDKQLLEN